MARWLFAACAGFYVLTMVRVDFDFAFDALMRYETLQFWLEHGISPKAALGADFEDKYFVGASLAMAPLYGLGMLARAVFPHTGLELPQEFCLFFAQLVSAFGVTVFFLICTALAVPMRRALSAALLYGVATMVWPYAVEVHSEPLVALTLLGAFYSVIRFKTGASIMRLACAGCCLALAVLTRPEAMLLALPIGVHAVHGVAVRAVGARQATRALVVLGSTTMLGPLGVLAWNYVRFGSPWDSGYAAEGFTTTPLVGLYGLLFSSGKGVFFYNPMLVVALFGWRQFAAAARVEAVTAGTTVVIGLCMYATFWNWAGDAAWGPRFLVTVLPFAIMPLAWVVWWRPRGLFCAAASLLIAASVAVQLLGTFVPIRADYEYKQDRRHLAVERFLQIGDDPDVLLHYIPSFSPLVRHARDWEGARTSLRWFPYDADRRTRSATVVGLLALLLVVVSGGMILSRLRLARQDPVA
jgi:hypothetical protein